MNSEEVPTWDMDDQVVIFKAAMRFTVHAFDVLLGYPEVDFSNLTSVANRVARWYASNGFIGGWVWESADCGPGRNPPEPQLSRGTRLA